ncbi:hypothetical protein [Sediminispirochaeta smaragdinae]|uniref:Uncharacterized protein n=1 Tax=Sediminispirochaeta smaragdinae (strain DSM 11293 / JCM 15392 / SEBR 4228) TaxID=573413 RepID=E1R4C1_SEDSS|nr:hypothetical protein [Sediminispirochaeta smaragdinae]ADK81662.1 hypothetical protein Spirs_2550 [Sediminispirochaeta smaragdinae DSM 11293]
MSKQKGFFTEDFRLSELSAHGAFELRGSGFKIYKYEADYKLVLMGSDKKSIPLDIVRITPKKVTALLPSDVKPKDY